MKRVLVVLTALGVLLGVGEAAAQVTVAAPTEVRLQVPVAAVSQTCGAPANPWGYNFCGGSVITQPASNFCNSFSCIPSFWNQTNGYVIQCRDGEFSHSGGRQGSCSSHGGNLRTLFQPAQAAGNPPPAQPSSQPPAQRSVPAAPVTGDGSAAGMDG
jgi:hypothetical protein